MKSTSKGKIEKKYYGRAFMPLNPEMRVEMCDPQMHFFSRKVRMSNREFPSVWPTKSIK